MTSLDGKRAFRLYATFVAAGVALIFAGLVIGNALNDSSERSQRAEDIATAVKQAREGGRGETCEVFAELFASQRESIAENDVRLQSGAFDEIIPQFATPAVKKISHENAVRNFNRFDNSKLPSYCAQRHDPEEIPPGFKRP